MELQTIKNLLNHKPVALIGVSAKPEKFGNAVFKTLQENGYEIFPVHHSLNSVLEKKCFRTLSQINPPPKSLILAAKPSNTIAVLQEFKSLGGEKVWFQQGFNSQEAFDYCQDNGLEFYHGKCILLAVDAFPHKFHKFFLKLFGALK